MISYLSRYQHVYWDEDGSAINNNPGYFGYKFLENGNPYDQIDNDGDGMVDESRSNGIDDDMTGTKR